MKRMKARSIAVVALSVCIACALAGYSCSRRRAVPAFSHSKHSAEIRRLKGDASVYRLYRNTEAGKRLVTEAYLEGDSIQTLLPTPLAWGCTARGFARSSQVLAVVACGSEFEPVLPVLKLQPDGSVFLRGRLLPVPEIRAGLKGQTSAGAIVVKVQLPIRWQHLHHLVDVLGGSPLIIHPILDTSYEPVVGQKRPVSNNVSRAENE